MEKFKNFLLKYVVRYIIFYWIAAMILLFAAEEYFNAEFPDVWLNEMRIGRNIDHYFELMESGEDIETIWGNVIVYPYENVFPRDIIDLRVRRVFGLFGISDSWIGGWVMAYIFEPGTTRAEMAKIIGDRGRLAVNVPIRINQERFLPSIVREGYTQIVFLGTGRRVVASIHSDNKNYEFDFGEFEDGYIRILTGDHLPITLTRSEETGRIVVRLITETD